MYCTVRYLDKDDEYVIEAFSDGTYFPEGYCHVWTFKDPLKESIRFIKQLRETNDKIINFDIYNWDGVAGKIHI